MLLIAEADGLALANLAVAVALAILTGIYVHLTHRLVQVSSEPCVIISVRRDDAHPRELLLVVENIGKGMAKDVQFHLSEPIPFQFSMDETPAIFRNGIPALAPGDRRVLGWGMWEWLQEKLDNREIKVRCKFKRVASGIDFSDNECDPIDCVLEIASFFDERLIPADGAKACAVELAEIANELRRFADLRSQSVRVSLVESPFRR